MAAFRNSNRFAIVTTITVVVALAAIVGVTIWINATVNSAASAGEAPQSTQVDAATGAFKVGSGSDTVATYIDFMCPICNAFEQDFGDSLSTLATTGEITLEIHPVAILDSRSQGTAYSTRAANAFYCVAQEDNDAAVPFMRQLFANQPQEGTPGLTDSDLARYASDAGAPGATSCITNQTLARYVTWMTKNQMPSDPNTGRKGTPTVVINGTYTPLSEFKDKTYFSARFGK